MPDKPSFKTELVVILTTGYFNISLGLLIILLGLSLPNAEWYKAIYFLVGLVIMSYPFFHYKDRRKELRKESKISAE